MDDSVLTDFVKDFVKLGNKGAQLGRLAVGQDPSLGAEVLVVDGQPVATRKLIYINGEKKILVGLWEMTKSEPPCPEDIKAMLEECHDPPEVIVSSKWSSQSEEAN